MKFHRMNSRDAGEVYDADVVDERIRELETEVTKLRAALDAAAFNFNELIPLTAWTPELTTDESRSRLRSIRQLTVDAMRACWAALGRWPL